MGLMKQLRDGEVVVEGNKMVESDGLASSKVDVKGKGRAYVPASPSYSNSPLFRTEARNDSLRSVDADQAPDEERQVVQEDSNDVYFRHENADYIKYWNELQAIQGAVLRTAETMAWDKLQADWDNFEATSSGIKAITHYQFQENNPYLLGDFSRTKAHLLHTQGRASILEVYPNSPARC